MLLGCPMMRLTPWCFPHGCIFLPNICPLFSKTTWKWDCLIDTPKRRIGGQGDVENSKLALESIIPCRVSELSQQNTIGHQRMHFDVNNHMYLHALSWKCSNEISSHLPKYKCHMWKLEAFKSWIDVIWIPNMYIQLLFHSLRCQHGFHTWNAQPLLDESKWPCEERSIPRYLYWWLILIWSLPTRLKMLWWVYGSGQLSTAFHILVGHPNVVGWRLVLIYMRITSTHFYLGSNGQVAY